MAIVVETEEDQVASAEAGPVAADPNAIQLQVEYLFASSV